MTIFHRRWPIAKLTLKGVNLKPKGDNLALKAIIWHPDVTIKHPKVTIWGQLLSDGEQNAFRGRGTQGLLSLRDMSLVTIKFWKGVLNCGRTIGGMLLTKTSLTLSTVSSGMNALNTGSLITLHWVFLSKSSILTLLGGYIFKIYGVPLGACP